MFNYKKRKYNTITLFTLFGVIGLFFCESYVSFAQNGVRIAATTGTADASAMLDVVSTTKGFLVPRLSLTGPALTNPLPVTSPTDGLLVYNLGASGIASKGFYYWNGTTSAWVQLSAGALSGSGTVNYAAKWTTTSALGNSQIFDNGTNVGVGVNPPLGRFDIQGAVTRGGTHATAPSFYVTGSLTPGQAGPASGNVEFRHDNGTQGIGFGYNTIYQTGSNTNQDLNLLSRGNSPLTLNAYSYSTGNVGVATTNPQSTLDIGGTSNSTYVQNMAAWGMNARAQGIMIMPEGTVSDDGSGTLTIVGTLIVMNPLSGSYIRVAAGTYALGSWGTLWVAMPPTSARGTNVTPSVTAWADGDRNYDGRDRIILAQRNGGGPVFFNFSVPQAALTTTGSVVQMVAMQTRTQGTYSAPPSGTGTQVTPLDITVTPRKAGNAMVLEWVINGEMHHDAVYVVTRNGTILGNATNGSNNRWSGVAGHPYDDDQNSTQSNLVIKIIDTNTLSTATTYAVYVRSSSGSTYTFALNRTLNNTGQDAYEATLSVGTATEIQQ